MLVNEINKVIEENNRRIKIMFPSYNPLTGEGSPLQRKPLKYTSGGEQWSYSIPSSMYDDNKALFDKLNETGSIEELLLHLNQPSGVNDVDDFKMSLMQLRFDEDFEYWANLCVKIQDKKTKKLIPFRLNRPQRRMLAKLENMRVSQKPIRLIIEKARQWGGSTLTQIYMGWMQNRRKENWHSAIIAHIDDQARNIRGMYNRLADNYPREVGNITFAPYQGSTKNRIITERNCIVGVGSAQNPNSFRSYDFAMGHLSEISFWKSTKQKSAEDLVQGFETTIPDVPDSLIVIESTAKGIGNFFHKRCLQAMAGTSEYEFLFVPWFEIEMYQRPIKHLEDFIQWVLADDYASFLWNLGATLEGINWYFDYMRKKGWDHWRMKEEFPSTPEEGFQSSGHRVFAQKYVQRARVNNLPPEFIGDVIGKSTTGKDALENIEFVHNDKGHLVVWQLPDKTEIVINRYVVTIDIGGRTDDADWSIIKVIDRYMMLYGGVPETVARWKGHIDQDLLSWIGAQIAKFYNNALLVVESNSLDTEENTGTEGNHYLTVLDEIVKFYPNIYARTDPEKVRKGLPIRYGFQTNMQTKPMVIDFLNGAIRDETFIERDVEACDEMDTYEIKPNGTYGATDGCHDDNLMTTAIGVYISYSGMPLPKVIEPGTKRTSSKIISEASI